jgi:uncharacterized Zn finger protein (UPF0148 family)
LSRKPEDDQYMKRMADLLLHGATLTDLACPACSAPLFRLKNGDLWCGRCEKKVVIVKEGEEPPKVTNSTAFDSLEATLLAKVKEIQDRMQHENNVEELQKLSNVLSGLLENLEKTKKAKKA